MKELKERTTANGMEYILVGDYYIPDLQLPEETCPIGIWGRMHKDYLEQYHPVLYAGRCSLTSAASMECIWSRSRPMVGGRIWRSRTTF